jgi:hypothetical protein
VVRVVIVLVLERVFVVGGEVAAATTRALDFGAALVRE